MTTYLSLAGRFCVLMPNTAHGGGISRKISATSADRKRLKSIMADLQLPARDGRDRPHRRASSGRKRRDQARLRLSDAAVGRNPRNDAEQRRAVPRPPGQRPDQARDPRHLQPRDRAGTRRRAPRASRRRIDLHAAADAEPRRPRSSNTPTPVPLFQRFGVEASLARHVPAGRSAQVAAAISSSTRPRRWSRSTSTQAARRASTASRKPRTRPTSKPPTRSAASSVCATWPGSSSSTSSTWKSAATTAASRSAMKEAMKNDRARIADRPDQLVRADGNEPPAPPHRRPRSVDPRLPDVRRLGLCPQRWPPPPSPRCVPSRPKRSRARATEFSAARGPRSRDVHLEPQARRRRRARGALRHRRSRRSPTRR